MWWRQTADAPRSSSSVSRRFFLRTGRHGWFDPLAPSLPAARSRHRACRSLRCVGTDVTDLGQHIYGAEGDWVAADFEIHTSDLPGQSLTRHLPEHHAPGHVEQCERAAHRRFDRRGQARSDFSNQVTGMPISIPGEIFPMNCWNRSPACLRWPRRKVWGWPCHRPHSMAAWWWCKPRPPVDRSAHGPLAVMARVRGSAGVFLISARRHAARSRWTCVCGEGVWRHPHGSGLHTGQRTGGQTRRDDFHHATQ